MPKELRERKTSIIGRSVLREPINGSAGTYQFRRNTFCGTCSLLMPCEGVVTGYGMERYCREIETLEVHCETLPHVLQANGISQIDFLKTALEGLDFEIIRSCRYQLGAILCIQCELRFKPFYEGEPYFHEVAGFLASYGYEVLDITHIDRWKYKTPQ